MRKTWFVYTSSGSQLVRGFLSQKITSNYTYDILLFPKNKEEAFPLGRENLRNLLYLDEGRKRRARKKQLSRHLLFAKRKRISSLFVFFSMSDYETRRHTRLTHSKEKSEWIYVCCPAPLLPFPFLHFLSRSLTRRTNLAFFSFFFKKFRQRSWLLFTGKNMCVCLCAIFFKCAPFILSGGKTYVIYPARKACLRFENYDMEKKGKK